MVLQADQDGWFEVSIHTCIHTVEYTMIMYVHRRICRKSIDLSDCQTVMAVDDGG